MSKSRSKRYYVENEEYEEDYKSKKKRFEDRRKTKKLKAALKSRNLEYFERDEV